MDIQNYIKDCYEILPILKDYVFPWEMTDKSDEIIERMINALPEGEYLIHGKVAIHKTAQVEKNVTIKDFAIIGKECFVSAGAYLRQGVYLDDGVKIGPNCEIKSSFIFQDSRIAHLNYVGNSIIGRDVNIEAGAILANHFNEKEGKDKRIKVIIEKKIISTNVEKFGSLIGDRSRIGANAVLNPGSILKPATIVDRLRHLDQLARNRKR